MQFVWLKKLCSAHKNFKTSIESWAETKKMYGVIQFNQKAWLKPCTDMNTKVRTEAKNDFEKDFLKLMNKAVFGKTMENSGKLLLLK